VITRAQAIRIRELIEKAVENLTDEEALDGVMLFKEWMPNKTYALNERVKYNDKLYKCVQAHTSQSDWTPDAVPALWTEIAPPDTTPVWRQPTGAQDSYMKGDKVHFPGENDPVYESLIDYNAWSPEAYPQGWQVQ